MPGDGSFLAGGDHANLDRTRTRANKANGAVIGFRIEFEAQPLAGGTLCHNGRWRAFDGGAKGTTPFRIFFKDGVFRGSP